MKCFKVHLFVIALIVMISQASSILLKDKKTNCPPKKIRDTCEKIYLEKGIIYGMCQDDSDNMVPQPASLDLNKYIGVSGDKLQYAVDGNFSNTATKCGIIDRTILICLEVDNKPVTNAIFNIGTILDNRNGAFTLKKTNTSSNTQQTNQQAGQSTQMVTQQTANPPQQQTQFPQAAPAQALNADSVKKAETARRMIYRH